MPLGFALLTVGAIALYAGIKGLSVVDVLSGKPGSTLDPSGGKAAVHSGPSGGVPANGSLPGICQTFTGSYRYGGGHGPKLSDLSVNDDLDCSSSVSLALYLAGMWDGNTAARVSIGFANWGKAGKGDITVYYSVAHVFIQGDGWRFDTGGPGRRVGPRYHAETRPTTGFLARHWE